MSEIARGIADMTDKLARLQDENKHLRAALSEVVEAAEGAINTVYDGYDHPAMNDRKERDLEPFERAKALLSGQKVSASHRCAATALPTITVVDT